MKKIVYLITSVVLVIILISCGGNRNATTNDGWVTIFDGSSFDGWRGYLHEGVPDQWTIENDGSMKFSGTGLNRNSGLDLLYDKKLKNFEFEMEWKSPRPGNSGLFYYAQEVPGMRLPAIAPEVQLGVVDGSGKVAKTLPGSLYDMKAADPQNAHLPGEWNKIRIVINNGKVTHFQNDVRVCEYTLWTSEWKEMLDNSKFSKEKWPESYPYMINVGGDNREGYIALQDHGTEFWFRNIKLKELK